MIPTFQDLDIVICLVCSCCRSKMWHLWFFSSKGRCNLQQLLHGAATVWHWTCVQYRLTFTTWPCPWSLTLLDSWQVLFYTFVLFDIQYASSQAVLLIIYLFDFRLQLSFLWASWLSLVQIVNSVYLKPDSAFFSIVASSLPLLFILWVMSIARKIHHLRFFVAYIPYICNEILAPVLCQKELICHSGWDGSQPSSGIAKSLHSVVLHSASDWSNCSFHSELEIPLSYLFPLSALVS